MGPRKWCESAGRFSPSRQRGSDLGGEPAFPGCTGHCAGGSRHHTLEPLLMVLSLAGEEGTTLSFPGHASTDFQSRVQNRAESCQEAFLGCRQQVCCPPAGGL